MMTYTVYNIFFYIEMDSHDLYRLLLDFKTEITFISVLHFNDHQFYQPNWITKLMLFSLKINHRFQAAYMFVNVNQQTIPLHQPKTVYFYLQFKRKWNSHTFFRVSVTWKFHFTLKLRIWCSSKNLYNGTVDEFNKIFYLM